MSETPREIIARADAHRRTAEAADLARTKIRLSETPAVRTGRVFFRRKPQSVLVEHEFTGEETRAIYAALAIVRDDNRRAADALDALVSAAPEERS